MVEQTLEPGTTAERVAQAHGLNANVGFHWRRDHRFSEEQIIGDLEAA